MNTVVNTTHRSFFPHWTLFLNSLSDPYGQSLIGLNDNQDMSFWNSNLNHVPYDRKHEQNCRKMKENFKTGKNQKFSLVWGFMFLSWTYLYATFVVEKKVHFLSDHLKLFSTFLWNKISQWKFLCGWQVPYMPPKYPILCLNVTQLCPKEEWDDARLGGVFQGTDRRGLRPTRRYQPLAL